jgi:hypothetical protein
VSDATNGIEHVNGTANVAPTLIRFSRVTDFIVIDNMSATSRIYISFDGGFNYKTIRPGVAAEFSLTRSPGFWIKADTDGTPYEGLNNYYYT